MKRKKCPTCKNFRDDSEFICSVTKKEYKLCNHCREMSRKWKFDNPEKVKTYLEESKDHIKETKQKWYQTKKKKDNI